MDIFDIRALRTIAESIGTEDADLEDLVKSAEGILAANDGNREPCSDDWIETCKEDPAQARAYYLQQAEELAKSN